MNIEEWKYFKSAAFLSQSFALRHWSFAIRHPSLISDVGPHSRNVFDAGTGPENA